MITGIIIFVLVSSGACVLLGNFAAYGHGRDLPEVQAFEDAEQAAYFTTFPM